jgi:hypothetical protein
MSRRSNSGRSAGFWPTWKGRKTHSDCRGSALGQAWNKRLDDGSRSEEGRLLRSITKGGKVGKSLSDWAVWSVAEQSAKEMGIERFGATIFAGPAPMYGPPPCRKRKSDLTGWSAQMYSIFGGVYNSWPGWNALRSHPI